MKWMRLKQGVSPSLPPCIILGESTLPWNDMGGLMSCSKITLDWTDCFLQHWLGVGTSVLWGGLQWGQEQGECWVTRSCQDICRHPGQHAMLGLITAMQSSGVYRPWERSGQWEVKCKKIVSPELPGVTLGKLSLEGSFSRTFCSPKNAQRLVDEWPEDLGEPFWNRFLLQVGILSECPFSPVWLPWSGKNTRWGLWNLPFLLVTWP